MGVRKLTIVGFCWLIFISAVKGQTATITYIGDPFCSNSGTVAPTITDITEGPFTNENFSAAGGLSIDANTGVITPGTSAPGTYTVTYTYTGSNSLPGNSSTSVTINALPIAAFSYTGTPYCQNASNPSPTFSAGGVAGIFSSTAGLIFLNNTTGQINLSASTPGTYTITNTIAASGGCPQVTATSSVTITSLRVATFSYTSSPFCKTAANPSPTFSGGGVAGTFSSTAGLVFVNSATGQINIAGSTAGTYTVTNTLAASGGCPQVTATSSVTITAMPVATFSYVGSPFCKTAANPSPTFSGGGVAGTFTSTAGLVFVSPTTGQVNLATSTSGTYTVTNTIIASGGCPQVTATATITITTLPVATFSYVGTPFCKSAANPSPTFSGGGVPGFFSSAPATLIFVSTSTGQINLSSSPAGTYTVTNTIASTGGCPQLSANSTVVISPLSVGGTATAAQPNICSGLSTTVTVSGYTGTIQWQQSPDGSTGWANVTGGTGATTATYTTPNLVSTTYYRAVLTSGSCTAANSTTASVTIVPSPVITATPSSNQTICSGTAITPINVSIANGGTFTWTRNNTTNVSGNPTGGSTSPISVTLTNNLNNQQTTVISITGTNGTCNSSTSINVVVNPKPTVNATNTTQTICSGTAITNIVITNPNTVAGTTFNWSRDNTANISGLETGIGANISGILNNTSNTQQVTIFTMNATAAGCSSTTNATITVNPTPSFTANPASQTICDLATAAITIQNLNTIAGTTYSWTRNNTGNITGTNSGTVVPISVVLDNTRNNLQSTVFTIIATANGCSSTVLSTVNVNNTQAPTINALPLSQTVCTGTPISNIAITASGGSITWTRNNIINLTGIAASGSGSPIAGTLNNVTASQQTTIFTATATNGICSNFTTATVTVNIKPSVTNQLATICSGTSFSITPTDGGGNVVPPGTTYTWTAPVSNPVGAITGGSAQGTGQASISQTLSNTTNSPATLTYSVTPTSSGAGSCSGTPFQVIVTVNPKPVVTNQSTSVCSGNSFLVSPVNGGGNIVPAGTTYTWTAPVSNPVGAITGGSAQNVGLTSISETLINNTSNPATLTYTVTPSYSGCAGNPFTVTVTVGTLPTITGPVLANQGSTGNMYITESGKSNYTWTISAGGTITAGQSTDQIAITWNSAGPQTVEVSYTSSGCSGTQTINVNVMAAATVSFQIIKSQTYPTPSKPGDQVTYTITYLNTSANTANNVIVTDNLPPVNLFTYVSSDHSGTYNPGSQSVTWNIGTVAPNGSGSVTVTGYWGRLGTAYSYNPTSYYTSSGSSTNTITNNASIVSDQSPLGFSAQNVSAVVAQTCGSVFPDGNNNFRQGENKIVYYPMTVVNTGNIYDNYSISVPATVTSQTGSVLRLRILDINRNPIAQSGWIPPGGSFSFLLELDGTMTPKPHDGDIFAIVVTSTSAVCGTVSTSTLNTTTYNGSQTNLQDIIVTKTASVSSYAVGSGAITYTISVSNIGQSDATGVTLTDNLPANVQAPVPADISPAGATISGNTVTWSNLTVAAGDILPPFTIIIHPNCQSVPSLINTAIATLAVDVDLSNNSSSVTIPVTYASVTPVPSTNTPIICANNAVILNASGASGSETYRWYTTAIGGTPFATGTPITTSPLTTDQTFYVSIYDPASFCESNRSSITIVVDPLPADAGAITGVASVCRNQSGVSYSVPVIIGALSYNWSYSGTGVTINGSGNSITLDFSATATSGTLTVFGHNICGDGASSQFVITMAPDIETPVFVLGATSQRCQGAGVVTYTASSVNSTSIIYSLDNASLAAGNTINAATGAVTYSASWSGTTVITASALGCNGPVTSLHSVTINPLPNSSPIYHR
jgi:hypothetical protein